MRYLSLALLFPLGLQHSAFTLRMEARLDHSHHIKRPVPRGELLELLSKALLYTEVEKHWKGDSLAANCKASFSLLEHHVCSLDAEEPSESINGQLGTLNVTGDSVSKRKSATPFSEDGRVEKRSRKEAEEKESGLAIDGPFYFLQQAFVTRTFLHSFTQDDLEGGEIAF